MAAPLRLPLALSPGRAPGTPSFEEPWPLAEACWLRERSRHCPSTSWAGGVDKALRTDISSQERTLGSCQAWALATQDGLGGR